MKNNKIKNTLLAVLVFMFQTVESIAKRRPPAPRDNEGFDTGGGNGVVGGPIDDFLPLLFFAALLLGIWAINRRKKESVI